MRAAIYTRAGPGDVARAAIYTRLSKDMDGDRLGVQRQEQDLRREADRRGVQVVSVHEDPDVTGSGLKPRPAFDDLIAAIEGGQVDLVLTYDMDRLFRGLKPFVRFYEAAERARIKVVWIGGEADFATGTGLFELELRASFAREELRKIKQRTRRKHLELAEHGKDAGGGRPFGYEPDRHTLRPPYTYCRLSDRVEVTVDEPELIRQAAERALAGEPLRGIAHDWQQRGVLPVKGTRWSASVLRRILVAARISGRRELCTVDGVRSVTGEIVATADWPAIVEPDNSDRLRALLLAPERSKEAYPRKYLLTGGLLRCGAPKEDGEPCGKPLHTVSRPGERRSYACISGPGFSDGCGRLRVNAEPLEAHVVQQALDAVDEGALARALAAREEDGTAREELATVEAEMMQLVDMFDRRELSREQFRRQNARLLARQEELQRQIAAQQRRLSVDGLEEAPLHSEWSLMPLHRQRAVLKLLVDYIEILPASRRGPVFDTGRVVIRWQPGLMEPEEASA